MEDNPKNYDDARAINAAVDSAIYGLYLEYAIVEGKKVGKDRYYSPDGRHFCDEYGQIFSVKIIPKKALPSEAVFRKLVDDYGEGIEVGEEEFDDFMTEHFNIQVKEVISQHFKFQVEKSSIPYWNSKGFEVYRLWTLATLFKPFYYINLNRDIYIDFLKEYDHIIYPGKIV